MPSAPITKSASTRDPSANSTSGLLVYPDVEPGAQQRGCGRQATDAASDDGDRPHIGHACRLSRRAARLSMPPRAPWLTVAAPFSAAPFNAAPFNAPAHGQGRRRPQ
jgi:hypothetical protein